MCWHELHLNTQSYFAYRGPPLIIRVGGGVTRMWKGMWMWLLKVQRLVAEEKKLNANSLPEAPQIINGPSLITNHADFIVCQLFIMGYQKFLHLLGPWKFFSPYTL